MRDRSGPATVTETDPAARHAAATGREAGKARRGTRKPGDLPPIPVFYALVERGSRVSINARARKRTTSLASLSILALAALCGSAQAATETPGDTFPASVTAAGAYAEGGVRQEATISADGRFVAFLSASANLSPEATASTEAYVKDLDTGSVTLASRGEGAAGPPADEPGPNGVERPLLSVDGHYLVFESSADNLAAGMPTAPVPPVTHVYRRDLQSGETAVVDRADGPGGEVEPVAARVLAVSADGRLVAFSDFASGLEDSAAAHPKGEEVIYVRDLGAGTTTEVAAEGAEEAAFSADGRYVLFTSAAPGLPEANGDFEVYRRDLQSGETLLVSRANPTGAAPRGEPADGEAFEAVFVGSSDCEVAFLGEGTSDLTVDGEDPAQGVYLRDFCSSPPATTLLSVREDGEPFEEAVSPSATVDGRVAFLGENHFPETRHLYLRDPVAQQTTLLDRASGPAGEAENDGVSEGGAKIASSGCRAIFTSEADNLFGGEEPLPGGAQAFVRQLAPCRQSGEDPDGGAPPGAGAQGRGGIGASASPPAPAPAQLKIVRLGRATLVLEFSGAGRATVRIVRVSSGRGQGRHLVKKIVVAASAAGEVRVPLPRLAPGRYRFQVRLRQSQAKSLVRALKVGDTG